MWKQMVLSQIQELFPNAKSEGLDSQGKYSQMNQTVQEPELLSWPAFSTIYSGREKLCSC